MELRHERPEVEDAAQQHMRAGDTTEGLDYQLIMCARCRAFYRDGAVYQNPYVCGICWIESHNLRIEKEGLHDCNALG